jgi:hypothetical protein
MKDEKLTKPYTPNTLQVNVFFTSVNSERLWDITKPIPGKIQVALNVNIMNLEKRSDKVVEAPFVFMANFTPTIAQITFKGKCRISGSENDLNNILKNHEQRKPPHQAIVQAVSNASIAEAIIISKALGIPPPLPSIGVSGQGPTEVPTRRYTT